MRSNFSALKIFILLINIIMLWKLFPIGWRLYRYFFKADSYSPREYLIFVQSNYNFWIDLISFILFFLSLCCFGYIAFKRLLIKKDSILILGLCLALSGTFPFIFEAVHLIYYYNIEFNTAFKNIVEYLLICILSSISLILYLFIFKQKIELKNSN